MERRRCECPNLPTPSRSALLTLHFPFPPFQFFIQLYSAISQDPILRRQAQPALATPPPSDSTNADLFSADIERYRRLAARSEEALVKLITSEVEAGLRSHLTRYIEQRLFVSPATVTDLELAISSRRWDSSSETATETLDLPPDLLPALLALSSHLALLSSLVPPTILAPVYRRIVDHLSNHIERRAVFAGWSKFTSSGGSDLAREISGWVNTCTLALGGVVRRPGAPWRRLEEMGKVLSLDDAFSEGEEEDVVKWSDVLAVLRVRDEGAFEGLRQRLELKALTKEELLEVVKRRVDNPAV